MKSALATILQPIRRLLSPACLALLAFLVIAAVTPSYNAEQAYSADIVDPTNADHFPLDERLAYASLMASGYLTLERANTEEPVGSTILLTEAPFNDLINSGGPDFACAERGHRYFEAARATGGDLAADNPDDDAEDPFDGMSHVYGRLPSIQRLTLAIVAAESYNRGSWDRFAERLYFRARTLFGSSPNISMGVAQIRPSGIRRIAASIAPAANLEDEEVLRILSDRCSSIEFASLIVADQVRTLEQDRTLGAREIILRTAAAYSGIRSPDQPRPRRYLNTIFNSYVILNEGTPEEDENQAPTEEDPQAALCLWFGTDGKPSDAIWTPPSAGEIVDAPAVLQPYRSSGESGEFRMRPDIFLRLLATSGQPAEIVFAYMGSSTVPSALRPGQEQAQVRAFTDLVTSAGLGERTLLRIDDSNFAAEACSQEVGYGTDNISVIGFIVRSPSSRQAVTAGG